MRVFLDTNVLLDLLLGRTGRDNTAYILELGRVETITVYTSVLTIADIAYIARKFMGIRDIPEILSTLIHKVSVLPMDSAQIQKALVSNAVDLEDAFQGECAIAAKCDCIVTNNVKHFKNYQGEINIFSPSEFLLLFKDRLS